MSYDSSDWFHRKDQSGLDGCLSRLLYREPVPLDFASKGDGNPAASYHEVDATASDAILLPDFSPPLISPHPSTCAIPVGTIGVLAALETVRPTIHSPFE